MRHHEAIDGLIRCSPALDDLEQRETAVHDLAPIHQEPTAPRECESDSLAVARSGDEHVKQLAGQARQIVEARRRAQSGHREIRPMT